MSEADEIEAARRASPEAVRTLARIALDSDYPSARREAIDALAVRGFLATNMPDDGELAALAAISDGEMLAVLGRRMQ